jgi:hypothetical protein
MLTKTVRSRFAHEPGDKVEGCTILEKHVIIPPDPLERRLGVYDYLVEVPPLAVKPPHTARHATPARTSSASGESSGGTRATPEMHGTVIRRVSSR